MSSLEGVSLIAGRKGNHGADVFRAFSPADGSAIAPHFHSATEADLNEAAAKAAEAAPHLATTSGADRAKLLRAMADGLEAASANLVERAHLETALPRPRLTGEVARTSNQLRLFASVVEEGSWVMARIDTAEPMRTPPKPDIRSMLRPLGPVAVFGASNFPIAFSVAGGDTASAIAAGNPVIVKAHPAHPGTSEIAGRVLTEAVASCGFPAGTFSLLFDAGTAIGSALVQHPAIRAVGFTGSFKGGRALMDLAAARRDPIPVYAEMGSANPVFILPHALEERGESLAAGLHTSYTLGVGQFCTKPGLVFLETPNPTFLDKLRNLTAQSPALPLLSSAIARTYSQGLQHRAALHPTTGQAASAGFSAQAALLEVDYAAFAANPALHEELFGPSTLLITGTSRDQMLAAARALSGHLTATILGTDDDLRDYAELIAILETKVGRIIYNCFPTGVEVTHAMVHGGPWPATSDGRSTSVGSQAILRFARPVCYQGLPQHALPAELHDHNPLHLLRLWNGVWQLNN
ncbi:MAG TPA: aldehyde dehydrogenase (NADP(+)) [Acidobacteriaceae bacterium]